MDAGFLAFGDDELAVARADADAAEEAVGTECDATFAVPAWSCRCRWSWRPRRAQRTTSAMFD